MSLDKEFSFKFSNKKEMERFLLVLNLGVLTGLKKKAITMDEAKFYLYKPWKDTVSEEEIDLDTVDELIEESSIDNSKSNISQRIMFALDRLMNQTIKLLKNDSLSYKN